MTASSRGDDSTGADHATATAVKARLLHELVGDARLRGVGLAREGQSGGFRVEVRVGEEQHIDELALPPSIDGVAVRVRAIGDVRAAAD